ncbi:MAG: TonB family protein [Candidatus Stygibacter australis]|nr:TonB family protein [Candidatus Stygibacter australis]MDP8322967.1 TonB family protein [Candidatus Stygibacter australis]
MQEGYVERLAVVVSVGMHIIVALVLLSMKFELDITPVQKLIEIVNYGVDRPSETGSNTQKPEGLKNPVANPVQGALTSSAPDNINLPKSVSQSEQEILEPVHDQIAWSDLKESDIAGNTPEMVKSGLDTPALSDAKPQQEAETASVKADKDFLAGLRERIAAEDSDSGGYTLSGEVINRTILNKVIPEYPEGLQQNSEVELRFEVTPDGKVGENIVILKKGGAQLDQVSLEALRQWRFNPISGEFIQTGVITFSYKLK